MAKRPVECSFCHKTVMASPARAAAMKFCSRGCYSASGKRPSPTWLYTSEVRAKMRATRLATGSKQRAERLAAVGAGLRECAKCKIPKTAAEYPSSRTNRHGEPRYRYCKPCHRDYQRMSIYRRIYKITIEDYEKMLAHQGGVCAICGRPPSKNRLAVDHNHKTGLIRGLLCPWCNRAIGQFRDDPERIGRTMSYLDSPPCSVALGAPRYGLKGRVSNKAETRRRLNRDAA